MKDIKGIDKRQVKVTQAQHGSKMSDSWSRQATIDSSLGKLTHQAFPILITELSWNGNPNISGTIKTKQNKTNLALYKWNRAHKKISELRRILLIFQPSHLILTF